MRYLTGIITGTTLTLALAAYSHTHHCQRILWWLSTRDVRHTHPHLYGRGRG